MHVRYTPLCTKPVSLPDPPRGQAVISEMVNITGAPARLQCDPPEDNGYPAVTWYEWTVLGGQTDRFNTSSNKWEDRTHSVTHSANYSCRVGNRVGASEFSRWLEVTVQGRSSLGLFTDANIYLLGVCVKSWHPGKLLCFGYLSTRCRVSHTMGRILSAFFLQNTSV